MTKKTRKIALWSGVGLAALALLAVPLFCGGGEAGPGGPGGPRGGSDTLLVTAAPVQQALLEDRLTTTGMLRAEEEVELRAEVAGRVTSLRFQEGSFVRRGQVLATVDTDVLEAELRAAQTRLDLAATQHERQRALFEIGGLSRQALDQAESALRVLEAEMDRLRAEIRRRAIVAPFAGVVGLREVSPGAYVSPGDRLATLRVTNPLKLEFAVPERYLGRVRPGDAVVFTAPGAEGPLRAEVYAVEPSVAAGTRAFTVRARVPNPGGALQPGAFAEVGLTFDAIEGALLVPTVAVVPGADSASVYVVRDGQAHRQHVGLGVRTADRVQVTAGLAPGDVVLTSGFDEVRPGQPVRVARGGFDPTVPAPEAPPPASPYRPATETAAR